MRSEALSPRITPGTGHCDKYFEVSLAIFCKYNPVGISRERSGAESMCGKNGFSSVACSPLCLPASPRFSGRTHLVAIYIFWNQITSIIHILTSDSNQVAEEKKTTKGRKKRSRRSKGFHRVGNPGGKGVCNPGGKGRTGKKGWTAILVRLGDLWRPPLYRQRENAITSISDVSTVLR